MNSKGMFYTNVSDYETKEDMMNDFIALRMYDMAKDKEIERLNNILDTLMQDMALLNATSKKEIKPKYVYVNSARQSCAMNGEFEKYKATAICYCWLIWEKGYIEEPIIRWV